MNIYFVDQNPVTAARMLSDTHVDESITTAAKLLCSVGKKMWRRRFVFEASETLKHGSTPIYPAQYKEHYKLATDEGKDLQEWLLDSLLHFRWLVVHGKALTDEYVFRFGKKHTLHLTVREAGGFHQPGRRSDHAAAWQWLKKISASTYKELHLLELSFVHFPLLLPERFFYQSPIDAYQAFYSEVKAPEAFWTRGRHPPHWWPYSTFTPPHRRLVA